MCAVGCVVLSVCCLWLESVRYCALRAVCCLCTDECGVLFVVVRCLLYVGCRVL